MNKCKFFEDKVQKDFVGLFIFLGAIIGFALGSDLREAPLLFSFFFTLMFSFVVSIAFTLVEDVGLHMVYTLSFVLGIAIGAGLTTLNVSTTLVFTLGAVLGSSILFCLFTFLKKVNPKFF